MTRTSVSVLVGLIGCAVVSASLPWLHTAPEHIVDSFGRTVILHGVSAVQKGFPWYWQDFKNTSRMDDLKMMGVNAVRLGWMWSGVEPEDGQFNETYIQITQGFVSELEDRGMYTLLDMHQDGASSLFCLYDGLPLWLVKKRSPPRHAFPWPLNASAHCDRGWETNFFAEAMGQLYQDLYDDTNGMQQDFIRFWTKSATVWANTSAIAGFELINEPWAGDVYRDPLLWVPGVADEKNLAPMYEKVAAGIRSVDDRHIIAFEGVTWSQFLEGKFIGNGFKQPPGGFAYANRSLLSVHLYCPVYHFEQPTKDGPFVRFSCDDVIDPASFDSVTGDDKTLQTASMLTEWGETDPRHEAGRIEADRMQGLADQHLTSWSWWDYAGLECYDSSGALIPEYERMISRTYPMATAGTLLSFSYNSTTAVFHMCVKTPAWSGTGWSPGQSSPPSSVVTEVYFNKKYYGSSGPVVSLSNPNALTHSVVDDIYLHLVPGNGTSPSGGNSTCITVTPSSQ